MNVDLRQTFYEHIAVATDFSPHADLALSYAIRTAKLHGAALDILHVVQDLIVYPEDPSMMVPLGDMADQLAKIAEAQMGRLLARSDMEGLEVHPHIIRTVDSPYVALVEGATEAGADLLVMGSHGRGGLAHILLGSTAEKVVRLLPCPVLCVPWESQAATAENPP